MKDMITTLLVSASALLVAASGPAAAMMSVAQLEAVYAAENGEAIGLAYSQGVFEGMAGLEAAHRYQGQEGKEFCRLFDMLSRGEEPEPHIATLVPELIQRWKSGGRDMDAPFADLMLSFLDARYGC